MPALAPVYTFLTLDDFAQVRAAIDPDAAAIAGDDPEQPYPDDLIAMQIYLGMAERWLLGKLPLAAAYTGADLQTVKNAVVLYVAALLLPTAPNFAKEDFGDYKYTRAPLDAAKLAGSLRLRAIAELAPLTYVNGVPKMFDLACGDRGL